MWMIISGSVIAVVGVFMALAKASSRAESVADTHREELLARAKSEEEDTMNDQDE